jgi:hypothetical protein
MLVVWLGVLTASCGSSSRQADPQTEKRQGVPSAAEVFHLRSECASLGEKILNANIIGPALTQSQTSHYDQATNRCYVELAVNTADLQHYEDYYARYLYDGQTSEMLAFTTSKKGQKTSNIFLPHDSKDSTGDLFWDANTIIDKMMADERGRGRSK